MIDASDFPYRQGVLGYIFNNKNEILIFQSAFWKSGYRLPGGGLKENEDHKEALKREIKEEFGLEIEITGESIYVSKYEWDQETIDRNYKEGRYFRGQEQKQLFAKVVGNNKAVIDRAEIRDFKWIPLDKVSMYFEIENQKDMVDKIREELKSRTLVK